jgi:hypothetical protein
MYFCHSYLKKISFDPLQQSMTHFRTNNKLVFQMQKIKIKIKKNKSKSK